MSHNFRTKKIFLSAIAIFTLTLTSCNQFKKTPNGMPYKITKGKSTETIKQGNIVKYHLEYRLTNPKDTILGSTYTGGMPEFKMYDSSKTPKYSFFEVFNKLAVGDKMEFSLSIDSLKKFDMIQEYNRLFKKGAYIKGKLEILKIFKSEADANADYQKEMVAAQAREEQKNKEKAKEQSKALEEYAKKNNLKTVTSPLGVLVSIEKVGDLPKIDTGMTAKITYRGTLMNGTEFDANVGPKAARTDLLPIMVGSHNVVAGMEDAMKLFGKGGKGKLLIPAALAYGDKENPGVFPANSNMIFDIEVIEVLPTKDFMVQAQAEQKKAQEAQAAQQKALQNAQSAPAPKK
ncbi:MAG: FKBP-type peptidyl-prolyl cis-trans isomerase [Chitinophagaceae bacterium]